MASFLDNSSDIILDAVLTDYGRQLLARGDGSFNIVKFALGDDEIDYSLWNSAEESPNEDTSILSTPILEAFTNNAASMKSKLLTINIENLLYLPVLALNTSLVPTKNFNSVFTGYVVPVDDANGSTTTAFGNNRDGVLVRTDTSKRIVIDQGLNSVNTNKKVSLFDTNPELYEREYNIFIDYRLGRIDGIASPLSVDDDGIAIYRVTDGNTVFVKQIPTDTTNLASNILSGTPGTRLEFKVVPQTILETTDTYFTNLGNSGVDLGIAGETFKTIRSFVKIVGVTTGYSIEIPILYTKK